MIATQLDYKKIAFAISILLIFLSTLIGTGVFIVRYRTIQSELDQIKVNPSKAIQIENRQIIAKVREKIDLPTDEQPTIAVINNLSALKNRPFFAKAKIGYRVLLFRKSQKAILYDPIRDKIIEVGPLTLPNPTTNITNTKSSNSSPSKVQENNIPSPTTSPKSEITPTTIITSTP